MVSPVFAGKVSGIRGAEEARKILKEVIAEIRNGDNVARPVMERLLQSTMQDIDANTPIRTGQLVSFNRGELVDNYHMRIYNETPYAGFVHNGTSRMPPRPFIEQALDLLATELPIAYEDKATEFIHKLEAENRPR